MIKGIEFISYDGRYPNFCRGTLTLKINGKKVEFKHCLCSGGRVWFDKNWNPHIENGEWTVDVPEEYKEFEEEITYLVNANVPYGCCGGCI